MIRLNDKVLPVALVAAMTWACGGGSTSSTRSVAGQLKTTKTMRLRTPSGLVVQPTAIDLIRLQLKNQPAVRARKSLPMMRALASTAGFHALNDKLIAPRPPISRAGGAGVLGDAFDANVAVFAYDDASGVFVDAQYLDTTSGAFDLNVVEDSPVSIWTGTYDMAAGTGAVVLPISYGFDDEIAPATTAVSFDYDPYFYVDPTVTTFDNVYVAATADQSGYYEFAGASGNSYFYLLPDDPTLGSYYLIADDGTCAQGTQLSVEFDSTGSYFSVNGVDSAFSMSGVTNATGNFSGDNVRWDLVNSGGSTVEELVTVTYLGSASTGPSCPTNTLADPCAFGGSSCSLTCPVGCSLDLDFGICTIDGTLDVSTGAGVSCELGDLSATLIICPVGCAEPAVPDGFCYVGGSTANPICY